MMKQLTYLLFFAISIVNTNITWANNDNEDKKEIPSFTVNAVSQIEVKPNEIYVEITLKEEKGEQGELENKEGTLLKAITKLGIDANQLKKGHSFSRYASVGWFKSETLKTQSYNLTLTQCCEVDELFAEFEKLEITDAKITGIGHTDLPLLKKQVRIEAMKTAMDKATYMLAEVKAVPGKPLMVKEDYTNVLNTNPNFNHTQQSRYNSNTIATISKVGGSSTVVSFNNIIVKTSVNVKFPIE